MGRNDTGWLEIPLGAPRGQTVQLEVAVDTALYSLDQGALFAKWLADWRDVQDPQSDEVPHTAPTYIGGGGPAWVGMASSSDVTGIYGWMRIIGTHSSRFLRATHDHRGQIDIRKLRWQRLQRLCASARAVDTSST